MIDSEGATGSGGTPSYDVPGSNVSGVLSCAFAFQRFSVPHGLSGLSFGFASYGFGEMGGEGNRFGVGVCESSSCTSSIYPLGESIFLEVSHCVPGNVSCPPGGWVERLIVNGAHAQITRTIQLINLTQYGVGLFGINVDVLWEASSSWLNHSRSNWTVTSNMGMTAYSNSTSIPNQRLVNKMQVMGADIDLSVLDGYIVDFSASCTICKSGRGLYQGSWANFAGASYAPIAPPVGYLGIEPSSATLALTVGASLSVILLVLVSSRRPKLWKQFKRRVGI